MELFYKHKHIVDVLHRLHLPGMDKFLKDIFRYLLHPFHSSDLYYKSIVHYVHQHNGLEIDDHEDTPFTQKLDEINQAFSDWMIKRAETVFSERLNVCMKAFPDLEMPSLKIRKLNKRWGSYLKKHEIVLNPALIKASKQAIDYVIYHELCHAYYPNHTEEFYNLLSLKMPNWEKVKEKMELKLLSY